MPRRGLIIGQCETEMKDNDEDEDDDSDDMDECRRVVVVRRNKKVICQ